MVYEVVGWQMSVEVDGSCCYDAMYMAVYRCPCPEDVQCRVLVSFACKYLVSSMFCDEVRSTECPLTLYLLVLGMGREVERFPS